MVGQCIAVPTNLGTLVAFHHYVSDLWLRTLRRRSQKDRKAWTDMTKLVAQWLPRPRIQHPWPNQRFAVKYPRWKPDAGKPHVRFCAGARSNTRPYRDPHFLLSPHFLHIVTVLPGTRCLT